MGENVTPFNTGIKYGGYLGAFTIIFSLLAHYAGWQDLAKPEAGSNITMSLLSIAANFAIIYLGVKFFRENNEGLLTFGEGVSVSLYIGLFAGIIGALFMYIFVAYIAPEFMDVVANSIDLDEMSEEEAAAAKGVMGIFLSPTFIAFSSFLGSIIGALIYGCIASLILKRGD